MRIATIISAARRRESQITRLEEQLAALKASAAKLKARIVLEADKTSLTDEKGTKRGEVVTESGTAKVTWPVASLALTKENLTRAKAIAGPAFGKIAEKIPVSHKLLKSARDLIPALLSKGKAQKLLTMLAGEPSSPRVTFS